MCVCLGSCTHVYKDTHMHTHVHTQHLPGPTPMHKEGGTVVAHGSPHAGRGSPAQTSREVDRAQDRPGPWACLLGLPKDRLVPHAADRACRPWVSSPSRTAPPRPASLCPRRAVCLQCLSFPLPFPDCCSPVTLLVCLSVPLCLSPCLSLCQFLALCLPLSPWRCLTLSLYLSVWFSVMFCLFVSLWFFSFLPLSLSPILSVSAH